MADKPLRLLAQDEEDLQVLSAALQDAVAKLGDVQYEAAAQRLTIACNRFRWEGKGERIRTALQLGYVQSVKARNVRREAKDAVVEILAITFEPGAEPPSGAITISLAGGGDLRCEVECIDAALADVSAPWPTRSTPTHRL